MKVCNRALQISVILATLVACCMAAVLVSDAEEEPSHEFIVNFYEYLGKEERSECLDLMQDQIIMMLRGDPIIKTLLRPKIPSRHFQTQESPED